MHQSHSYQVRYYESGQPRHDHRPASVQPGDVDEGPEGQVDVRQEPRGLSLRRYPEFGRTRAGNPVITLGRYRYNRVMRMKGPKVRRAPVLSARPEARAEDQMDLYQEAGRLSSHCDHF
ncbi:hypothetical protein EVAR_17947_1 [Eumeta japonica]|uniref:Uncharacterized protein n=1 Tax=Eumeta variegata TaxID=151549 RepID=A0A4C1UZL8_EUMVA|nr:hypothetical protein EVAR_17947_1 [Eumeta japonica]